MGVWDIMKDLDSAEPKKTKSKTKSKGKKGKRQSVPLMRGRGSAVQP